MTRTKDKPFLPGDRVEDSVGDFAYFIGYGRDHSDGWIADTECLLSPYPTEYGDDCSHWDSVADCRLAPDDRLSRCLSDLRRHDRGIAQAEEEMAGYSVLSDFREGGYFDRAARERTAILARYGYSPETFAQQVADRLGLIYEGYRFDGHIPTFRITAPDGERISLRQGEVIDDLPETREMERFNAAMAGTP